MSHKRSLGLNTDTYFLLTQKRKGIKVRKCAQLIHGGTLTHKDHFYTKGKILFLVTAHTWVSSLKFFKMDLPCLAELHPQAAYGEGLEATKKPSAGLPEFGPSWTAERS